MRERERERKREKERERDRERDRESKGPSGKGCRKLENIKRETITVEVLF